MATTVYLDHNATTQPCKRAIDTLLSATHVFGNPSSKNSLAKIAKNLIAAARSNVATLLGANPDELIFTSGGSESNNWAIKGASVHGLMTGKGSGHLVVSAIEHASILQVADYLERVLSYKVTRVAPNREGIVEPAAIVAALRPDTHLVSVMLVNNEVGSIQPIKQIAKILGPKGIHFHVDGVQGVGKVFVDVHDLQVDTLSFSAHKFYGPKGIGGLYIRPGVILEPLIHGGGQENGLRGGTEAVALIASMGAAAEAAHQALPEFVVRTAKSRNQLKSHLSAKIPGCAFNGPEDDARLAPNTLSLRVKGVRAEAVAALLDQKYGIQVALGAACSNNKATSLSHVLTAMGLSEEEIKSTLRISIGQSTKKEDLSYFATSLAEVIDLLGRVSRGGAW